MLSAEVGLVAFRECVPVRWPTGGKRPFLAALSRDIFFVPRYLGIIDPSTIGTVPAHNSYNGQQYEKMTRLYFHFSHSTHLLELFVAFNLKEFHDV